MFLASFVWLIFASKTSKNIFNWSVCVCIETSENSSFCISKIPRKIELKFGVDLKQTERFLCYHFRVSVKDSKCQKYI